MSAGLQGEQYKSVSNPSGLSSSLKHHYLGHRQDSGCEKIPSSGRWVKGPTGYRTRRRTWFTLLSLSLPPGQISVHSTGSGQGSEHSHFKQWPMHCPPNNTITAGYMTATTVCHNQYDVTNCSRGAWMVGKQLLQSSVAPSDSHLFVQTKKGRQQTLKIYGKKQTKHQFTSPWMTLLDVSNSPVSIQYPPLSWD